MEEKKEKAIEAAREHFHRFGYGKTSLSKLISEIGISKSTFYNYFKNKEELFCTVMRETYNEFHYHYAQSEKNTTNAIERIYAYVTTYVAFLDSYPLFRDLYKPGNDLLAKWTQSRYCKEFFAEGVESMRSIIEQGIDEGIFAPGLDPDSTSLLLYYLLVTVLSSDPAIYQKHKGALHSVDSAVLLRLLGHGLLSREE
jgi:AcrR family transcriptional regulator